MRAPSTLHGRRLAGGRRAHAATALSLSLSLADLASVQAHQQYAPSTVNRYGKLVLTGARGGRLVYTLMVGDVPAGALRAAADRNRDGRLDAAEQAALCSNLGARVRADLRLWFNDSPLAPTWDAPSCALSGSAAAATLGSDAVAPLALSCELTTHIPTPAPDPQTGRDATYTLRYDDHVALPPIGEVEFRVEDGPEARLLTTFQGQAPTAQAKPAAAPIQRIFQQIGPPLSSLSDRSITVRFAVGPPRRASTDETRRWLYGAVGALLTILSLGLYRILRAPRPPVRRMA